MRSTLLVVAYLLGSSLLLGCVQTMPVQQAASSTSQFEGAVYAGTSLSLEKPLPGIELYRTFGRGGSGFVSLASVRGGVETTSNQFCEHQGKTIRPVQETASSSVPLPGNFPRIEWLFQCVDPARVETQQYSDNDKLTQLERLENLLGNGTLTQQEFEDEKAKILGASLPRAK